MVDIVLILLKRFWPSRYKGLGLRGGIVLAAFWGVACGTAGFVGWSVLGIIFFAIAGGVVGYRLEKVGGAVAVAIFTALYWSIVALCEWGPILGLLFGAVLGLMIGSLTRE